MAGRNPPIWEYGRGATAQAPGNVLKSLTEVCEMASENAEPNRMRARIPEMMGGGRRGWWSWQRIVFGCIGVVVGFFILRSMNPFVIINAGERGIVLNFGAVSEKVLDEGLHFRIPVY